MINEYIDCHDMIFASRCNVCNNELSEHSLIVIICYYPSYKQTKTINNIVNISNNVQTMTWYFKTIV